MAFWLGFEMTKIVPVEELRKKIVVVEYWPSAIK